MKEQLLGISFYFGKNKLFKLQHHLFGSHSYPMDSLVLTIHTYICNPHQQIPL